MELVLPDRNTANNIHRAPGPGDNQVAIAKLEAIVREGVGRAQRGWSALESEANARVDLMAKPTAIDVVMDEKGVFTVGVQDRRFVATPHAKTQMLARASIPLAFADTCQQRGDPDLLRFAFSRLLPKVSDEGLLIRAVGPTVKGVLSPAYRRMDARFIFEAFIRKAKEYGLVPYRGEVTDTRVLFSYIEPKVRTVAPGEHMVLGVDLRTSDYGNGKLALSMFVLRLLCLNGLTGMDLFSRVHLGRRFDFSDQEGVENTAAVQSALGDTLKSLPPHMEALEKLIVNAAAPDEKFSIARALETLRKQGVKKAVTERVKALYEAQMPVEALPQDPGPWRFANVLSLIANGKPGESFSDDAVDLQDAAFLQLPGARA
jgi:hypothetical protein